MSAVRGEHAGSIVVMVLSSCRQTDKSVCAWVVGGVYPSSCWMRGDGDAWLILEAESFVCGLELHSLRSKVCRINKIRTDTFCFKQYFSGFFYVSLIPTPYDLIKTMTPPPYLSVVNVLPCYHSSWIRSCNKFRTGITACVCGRPTWSRKHPFAWGNFTQEKNYNLFTA